MEEKKEIISYVQGISLFLLGIFFVGFPIIFTSISTNPIVLPKQILLGGVVMILLVLQALRMLAEKSVKFRKTPFDLPIILVGIVAFFSAILAVNRADSLTAFLPYFFAILGFFLITNIAKDKSSILFLVFSLIAGSVLVSLSAILSFFKIYLLPSAETHTQTFTPLGSLLEQNIYLVAAFCVSFYYLIRFVKSKKINLRQDAISPAPAELNQKDNPSKQELMKLAGFAIASLIILMAIITTTYSLFEIEKPFILPIETGFQTALSEISLDTGRIAQGFLFGSGIGTYTIDFSRWKQAVFNQNQDLWSLTFFRSSTFALELLATTGVLGLCSFIFLAIRALKEMRAYPHNKMFLSFLVLLLISFLLPLNFIAQTLFFVILGLFAANQGLISKMNSRFFDLEFQIVAFKKGLISIDAPHAKSDKSLILPSFVSILIILIVGTMGYFGILYVISDLTFQKSLVAASQNNGSLTYQLQAQAISTFPYRDSFYRVFSQTNLALANTLASQQPKGSTPDTQVQQNITTLIQQSINSARAATTVSPQTYLNWQNLSSIYRGLIGFGQNAESFSIATAQQAINLDPNNPQQYISLGGIYYQLGQWDNAQNQFQIAIALKPDFANSHYNLGHTLEQKGDTQNALAQYQIVRTLVASDKTSLDQIAKEIEVLQGKAQAENITADANQPLSVDKPQAQLPPQNPPVKIPAPNEPSVTPTKSPSPTPQP